MGNKTSFYFHLNRLAEFTLDWCGLQAAAANHSDDRNSGSPRQGDLHSDAKAHASAYEDLICLLVRATFILMQRHTPPHTRI